MRKVIYKLFLTVGLCASALGLINPTVSPLQSTATPTLKAKTMDSKGKLYFTDAIKGNDASRLHAAHYSHRSHASHESHRSHYSHTSSRW